MSAKNSLFKIFTLSGPLLVFTIFITMILFLIYNLQLNVTELLQDNNLITVIFELLQNLKSPIIGTLMITFFSVLIAAPAGIITGIYLHEYAGSRVKMHGINLFKYLSSAPSIIIGVCGLVLIITLNHLLYSQLRTGLFVSAISLALLVLPYMVHSTVNALAMIPAEIRLTAVALGAKKHQNIIRVLLPEAITPILSGIVLSIGRSAEDTAVIMLTGAAAFAGIPAKFNDAFEALPFFIYYKSSEAQGAQDLALIFSAAIIIIVISSLFIYIADRTVKKFERRIKGFTRHE